MKAIAIVLFATLGWFHTAKAEEINFRISPNPASSKVELAINNLNAGAIKIEIYTVLGTLAQSSVFIAEKGSNTASLHIGKLAEGIYLVRIVQNGHAAVKRLKIQHTE